MLAWIGKSIVFIGVVHSVFGFVVFRGDIAAMFTNGLFDTIDGHTDRTIAFWFISVGFMAMLAGALADWCERRFRTLPGFFGTWLLMMTIVFVVLMPVSGAWMLFVPAVASILRAIDSGAKDKIDGLLKT